jgi:hypothetical protein
MDRDGLDLSARSVAGGPEIGGAPPRVRRAGLVAAAMLLVGIGCSVLAGGAWSAYVHTQASRTARDLNLNTVAEGIETAEQLTRLRLEECKNGQGFLFARPLTVAALDELFAGAQGSDVILQPSSASRS